MSSTIAAHRARGIALIEELTARFPVHETLRRLGEGELDDGRARAARIEKEWLGELPESFRVGSSHITIRSDFPARFWIDLALVEDGVPYLINFKAGAGRSADNVGGLKLWRYLLLGEELDPETLDLPRERVTECQLALRAGAMHHDRSLCPTPSSPREYFCLHASTRDGSVSAVPISALEPACFETNPKNGLQVKMRSAAFDLARDAAASHRFVLERYAELLAKQAAPFCHFRGAAGDSD